MGQIDLDHGARLIKPYVRSPLCALAMNRFYLAPQQTARVVKNRVFRPKEKLARAVNSESDAAHHRSPEARAAIRHLDRQPI